MRYSTVRKKAAAGGVVVAALVALMLLVVLPALASSSTPTADVSNEGVPPYTVADGGQNDDCSVFYPGSTVSSDNTTVTLSDGTTLHQFYVNNPKNTPTATDPATGATFNLSVSSSNTTLSYTSTGAKIWDVGINGGKQSNQYHYPPNSTPPGTASGATDWPIVTQDGNLHAPLQGYNKDGTPNYYSVSHTAFCYQSYTVPISGTVFSDLNGDGSQDGTPTEGGVSGATVTLTNTTTGQSTTTQTAADGTYSFNQQYGTTYTICVTPPTSAFVQTFPTSGTTCPGIASVGYSVTPTTSGSPDNNFGLEPYGSVSGIVYQDVNGPAGGGPDGHYQSSLDTPLGGWTVNLYKGTTLVDTTTSNASTGTYNFTVLFDAGAQYTVCVTPDSGSWAQSEPLPSAGDICGSPNLPKGQQFTPTLGSDSFTENFGVAPAIGEGTCPPQTPFGGDQTGGELQIQLGQCKAGQTFVFDTGNYPPPNGAPWASVWAGDQTLVKVPMIEKWLFPDPIKADGTPTYTHIDYTDVFPYDPSVAQQMPMCKLDPRDSSDPNGMTLSTNLGGYNYTLDTNKGRVLPSYNPDGTTPATSCAISIRIYVDASGNSWLEVYAYSDIDSWGKAT